MGGSGLFWKPLVLIAPASSRVDSRADQSLVLSRRSSPRWFPLRLTPYDRVRFAIAALLLTAAGLKAFQLATEPILETGLLHWRPLLIAAVEFELFLAFWLISGVYARVLWWTTLVCFVGFAQITLYRAVTGEASCGCFGTMEVNPWWMSLVDTAVVTLLLCFRPAARTQVTSVRTDRRHLVIVLLLTLIVGIPAGAAIVHYGPVLLRLEDDPTSGRSFILLEPERWVGHKFPLFSQIDVGPQLRHGRWAMLFFRHDCPKCQRELRNLQQHAASFMGNVSGYRVCLIEVPPFGYVRERPTDLGDRTAFGQLNRNQEWLIETPAWIRLQDGTVARVGEMDRQTTERTGIR